MARLIGADAADIALIPSVSSAAGLVAAQFGRPARARRRDRGAGVQLEPFPWRQLAGKGYDVRQVPFRNGGLEPDDVAQRVDGGTRLVAFSGVQTATGHRSDIAAISGLARAVGAIVFVDGSQLVGALPVADDLRTSTCWWRRTTSSCSTRAAAWVLLPVTRRAGGSRRSTRAGGRAASRSRASSAPR